MRVVVLALAIVTAGCGGAATAPASPEAPAGAYDEAGVRRVVERWRLAHEARDVNELARLYARGDTVTLTRQGVADTGWAAIEARLRERLGTISEARVRLSEVRVAPTGAGAVVTAAIDREVSDGVTVVREVGVLTLVLAPATDRGVIVAEHFSFAGR